MHRARHSVERMETDSDDGFFLSIRDRLFATMSEAPALGLVGVVLGPAREREAGSLGPGRLLAMRFERRNS